MDSDVFARNAYFAAAGKVSFDCVLAFHHANSGYG